MSRGRSLLVLLVVAAGLGAYIYFVESRRPPASEHDAETLERVFPDLDDTRVATLTVKASSGATTTLEKEDATWRILEPIQAAADQTEVSSLTSSLSTLELQRVVVDEPTDVAQFGLEEPRIEVAFRVEGEDGTHRLLLGEKTPTEGDVYARVDDEPRVVLVPAWMESTFDRDTFALREKNILSFDRDAVDRIEVTTSAWQLELVKQGDDWRMVQPWSVRVDASAVDSLLGRLASGRMQAIVAEDAQTLDTYRLDRPTTAVTLHAGSAAASLLLGRDADDEDVYAKDGARPTVFTVDSTLADDLRREPSEYRPRQLFAFRNFIGKRLEITRDEGERVFEKARVSEDPDATERWTQVQPPAEVDATTVDDLASRIADVRADTYLDTLPPGSTEVVAITALSEGNPSESVTLYRSGEEVYAIRSGEPGAARLPPAQLDNILTALDAIE